MRLTRGLVVVLAIAATAQSPPSAVAPASGRISGRAITPDAALVAGAMVVLYPLGEHPTPRETRTDPRGRFSFAGLRPGRYRLTASKAGFTSRQPLGEMSHVSTPARGFRGGVEVIVEEHQPVEDIEIRLHRAARIAGRIIQTDGSAAPGVQVTASYRSGAQLVPLLETRTVSAWDGRYEIADLPPGTYYVSALPVKAPAPHPDLHQSWYPGVREDAAAVGVRVLEGLSAEGIDLWLTPSRRFNVSGRVFWAASAAPDKISVDYGDPKGTWSGVWYLSDPGGLFTLTGVTPGPLVLLARAETNEGTLLGLATTQVSVDAVEDIRVDLERPGVVDGRVVYDAGIPTTERPSSIALVQKLFRVSAVYPEPEADIGSDGRFRLGEALGEYELELRPHLPANAAVTVRRDGIVLNPPRIRVSSGELVNGLEVRVTQRR